MKTTICFLLTLLVNIVLNSSFAQAVDFRDDFEDASIDTDKWVYASGSGSVTESEGYLKTNYRSGSTPHAQVRNALDFMQENVTVTIRMKPVYIAGNKNIGFWLGDINTGSVTGFEGIFHSTDHYTFTIMKYNDYNGSSLATPMTEVNNTKTWTSSSDFYSVHEISIVKEGYTYSFFIDGEFAARDTDQSTHPASLYFAPGRPWMEDRWGEYGEVWVDEIIVESSSVPDDNLLLFEDYNDLNAGQALPGWISGVYAQNIEFKSAPMGAKVTTNIPGAYTAFPLTQGELVFEVWMKPEPSSNTNNSFQLGNDSVTDGVLFWKGSDGIWHYHQSPTEGSQMVNFGAYDGNWHFFRLIYTTSTNRYDLYMDGALIGNNILWLYDLSAGISKVGFNSGRWGYASDTTSYFDDLKVYIKGTEPLPGEAKLVVDTPESAQPGESFRVDIMAQDVQNLFGVSFELSYTQGDYVDVELVESGDFLGSDIIFYPDTDEEAGKISVGMSRKAGQGEVDGSGVLVRVQFTSGSETPVGTVVDFSLGEITANDEDGSPLTFTGEGGSTILQSGITVWPGDTNNDGTVNQADILPLGIYWGSTGQERTGGSNSWTGQPCFPWSPEAATYADATGNGKVNQEDVLPIGLNWDKTHTVSKIEVHKAVSANGSIKPVPVIEAPEKTGEEFWVEIMVEDVSSLFGLSFVVSYDNKDKIEPVTVENNDFLGDDILFFPMIDSNSGDIAVGISRKSGQDGVGGSGIVVKIKFRILKDFGDNPAITFYLNDVVANDQTGECIELEIENGHIGGVHVDEKELPRSFSLSQNHPNPFNPVTSIPFALPRESRVSLTIYSITGEKVAELADGVFPPGKHSVEWDAGGFSSGIYFYKIKAGKFVDTKKLLLLK